MGINKIKKDLNYYYQIEEDISKQLSETREKLESLEGRLKDIDKMSPQQIQDGLDEARKFWNINYCQTESRPLGDGYTKKNCKAPTGATISNMGRFATGSWHKGDPAGICQGYLDKTNHLGSWRPCQRYYGQDSIAAGTLASLAAAGTIGTGGILGGAGFAADYLPTALQGTGLGAKMDIISYSAWIHNKGKSKVPPMSIISVERDNGPEKGKQISISTLNAKLRKNQEEEDILFQKFDSLQELQEKFEEKKEEEREKRRIAEEEERRRLQTEREAANDNALREAAEKEAREKEAAELKILEDIVQKVIDWIRSIPHLQNGGLDYDSVEMPEGILMEHINKIKPVTLGGTAPEVVSGQSMKGF